MWCGLTMKSQPVTLGLHYFGALIVPSRLIVVNIVQKRRVYSPSGQFCAWKRLYNMEEETTVLWLFGEPTVVSLPVRGVPGFNSGARSFGKALPGHRAAHRHVRRRTGPTRSRKPEEQPKPGSGNSRKNSDREKPKTEAPTNCTWPLVIIPETKATAGGGRGLRSRLAGRARPAPLPVRNSEEGAAQPGPRVHDHRVEAPARWPSIVQELPKSGTSLAVLLGAVVIAHVLLDVPDDIVPLFLSIPLARLHLASDAALGVHTLIGHGNPDISGEPPSLETIRMINHV